MTAPDLATLVAPDHTVVVTQECQQGVIGEGGPLPELAAAAQRSVVPNGARLLEGARAAGIDVVHCIATRRPDGRGSNTNARLFAGVRKKGSSMESGTAATEVVPEFGPEPSDVVLSRLHGIGPMGGTDLDAVLRNLGATTVVGIGVSVNLGMTNFAMDAVNAGYQFVLPRDAVAGVPDDYADAVIDGSLAYITTVVTTDELLEVWS